METNKATALRRLRKRVLSKDLLNWQTCRGHSVSPPNNLTSFLAVPITRAFLKKYYIVRAEEMSFSITSSRTREHQNTASSTPPSRGGGGYSFVACLHHLITDHASLSKRSTVPTPNRDTVNILGAHYTFAKHHIDKKLLIILSPPCVAPSVTTITAQRGEKNGGSRDAGWS